MKTLLILPLNGLCHDAVGVTEAELKAIIDWYHDPMMIDVPMTLRGKTYHRRGILEMGVKV